MKTYHLAKLEKDIEWLDIQVRLALVATTTKEKNDLLKGISRTFDFDISDLEGLYE